MMTCSESSLAAGEPIGGSAVSSTWRWLGLEYRGTWHAKAVENAELPAAARAWLARFDAEDGTRVQLIRRRGSAEPGALTCFFADTRRGIVRRMTLAGHEALADVELHALLAGDVGEAWAGPLVWVCTHGQRDACCARHGGRVLVALEDALGAGVWQTTHLGGHRFAATLLWLPDGLCYGRLREEHVPGLVAGAADGEVFALAHLRGRVAWSSAAQAAEIALRAATGHRRVDGIALVAEDGTAVTLRIGGVDHVLRVERRPVATPVIPSCGKAPELTTTLAASEAAG